MSTDAKSKRFLRLERERLTRYQHQHRGVNFLKLWLPPTTERKVNIIGLNNHIYKGKIPTVPLDQLPPEVDPKSIDEEALFKEIRDMRFPVVPPLKPLGPARRIGGEHTTAKRITFAPVMISLDQDKTETPVLGADGKIYRGGAKAVPVHEMDRKLRGTKRPVKTQKLYSSSRGTVTPTVVSLYVDGKPPSERKPLVPLIELPYADLDKLIKLMEIKSPQKDSGGQENTEERHPEEKEDVEKDNEDSKPAEAGESEVESSKEFTSSESVGTASEVSDVAESSTTSITEGSSDAVVLVSEGEETDVEASEPEASEPESEAEIEET